VTPERWLRVKALLARALEEEAPNQESFVNRACEDDEDVRNEVFSLLARAQQIDSFLEEPLLGSAIDLRRLFPEKPGVHPAMRSPVEHNPRSPARLTPNESHPSLHCDGTYQTEASSRASEQFPHASLFGLGGSGTTVLPVGTKLASGRLSIVRRIGEGGMGAVYEAFDTYHHHNVALKTLTRVDPTRIYRLKNEFRSLAGVTHEHLVKLYELFNDNGTWFFTMELVTGVPFDRWVRPDNTLDEAKLRDALRQLVGAVRAIHANGKLHRDLKPNNVLVTHEGRVVVLDFGLAIDREPGGIGQTATDDCAAGTPAYMPPEQIDNAGTTAAGDWYQIGVMLFQALTGMLPFSGSILEMLAAKHRDMAPLASSLAPAVSADLDTLCAKLLARAPEARPDGSELCATLRVPPLVSEWPAERVVRASPSSFKLLGRAAELNTLRDAYEASCTSGKPVVVLVSGESGIGKSALCDAFLAELRARQQVVVLSGRCFERESVPFRGFDVIVDDLSRYLRRLPERDVLTLVPRDTYALRCLFPVLGRIAAIAEAPPREVHDPHELRRRAFSAFAELLGRMRDRQALVLYLDDWHWSDTDSMLLLTHLLRHADAPRMLLLLSHRSEQENELSHLRPLYHLLPFDMRLDVRQLCLGPLSAEAAQALLRSEIGCVSEAVTREAGGNPFLLGEIGRYIRKHSPERTTEISLEHVIARHAQELPDAQRRLLYVLAVAARPIDLRVAVKAAGTATPPHAIFDALRDSRLARATGKGDLVECYHDKIRETLLRSETDQVLREHHRALASALAAQQDADPEQLAAHLLGAGDGERAAQQIVRAAEQAYKELAFDRAARLYTRALEHGRFDAGELQRLRVAQADALAEAGRGPESAEAYLSAMRYACGDARHALERRAANQYLYSGQLQRGRSLLAHSLARRRVRLRANRLAAATSLLLERAHLWLRGFDYRERPPDPELTAQLASLQTSARALGRLDFVRGAHLSAHYLRLALDAGDTAHVTIGLSMEVWHRTLGIGNGAGIPSLLARAEALLFRTDAFKARCWLHFCRGFYLYYGPSPDLEAAIADFDRFLELTNEQHYENASYDRRMAEHNRINARVQLGRVAEVARGLPSLLDDAYERRDFVVLPLLAGQNSTLALIAVGAPADAGRELDRASRAWASCCNAYTFQDCFLLAGATFLALARGDAEAAWLRAQDDVARFVKSSLRSSRPLAESVRLCAASAALALAAKAGGSERLRLMRQANQLAKRIPKNAMRGPVQATLSWLRGEPDKAISTLRDSLADMGTRRTPLYTQMIRRRLGEIIGGSEGKVLVAEADAFLRAGGAVDPAFLASICVMPGIEPSRS
jgi:hypothetical protein